jgi:hypothetical protein
MVHYFLVLIVESTFISHGETEWHYENFKIPVSQLEFEPCASRIFGPCGREEMQRWRSDVTTESRRMTEHDVADIVTDRDCSDVRRSKQSDQTKKRVV